MLTLTESVYLTQKIDFLSAVYQSIIQINFTEFEKRLRLGKGVALQCFFSVKKSLPNSFRPYPAHIGLNCAIVVVGAIGFVRNNRKFKK